MSRQWGKALGHQQGRMRGRQRRSVAQDRGALSRKTEALYHVRQELCRPRQSRASTIGMRARLGWVHDRGASATEVFYRNIVTEISLSRQTYIEANKKYPWDLGRHTIFLCFPKGIMMKVSHD